VPMSDLFGTDGTRPLDELRLGRAYALRIAWLRSLITADDQQITMLGREDSTALAGDVGYLAIQAIPGVGSVLAAVLVAEIGQVHRFAGAPPLCSWAGLTPATASPTPPCAAARSPNRAPGWSAGPRWRRCSGYLEEASRLPTCHRIADRRGTSHRPRRRRPQAAHPGRLRPARRPGTLPGSGAQQGDVNGSGR
jgi:Transposase IS116/IS110/IS902 family